LAFDLSQKGVSGQCSVGERSGRRFWWFKAAQIQKGRCIIFWQEQDMDIRLFFWTHPWWHAALIIVPPIALSTVLGLRELSHSKEANRLRSEANRYLAEANRLGEEAARANEQANQAREEANRLREHAKNAVVRIADNTTPAQTQADRNAVKLRKYLRQRASVSEGNGHWGAMGAEIVEVSEDNVLTLFTPAGYTSTSAFAVYVQCDELQIIEQPVGGCPVQIKVLKRYGETLHLGEIRKWEDKATPSSKPLPRGNTVYHANFTLPGSSQRRSIHIYAPTDGNPQYTLVSFADAQESGVWYGSTSVEISKKFAILQIDWRAEGYQYGGGGSGGSSERLFLFTN
jgi:hypothetical protein